jgi:hypothetical protein
VNASADRTALLRDAAFVVAAKVLVSIAVLATGFRALSDDDYARIVIAQRFATAPQLDPSGTSWLPLPFWTTGGAMAVLGRSVEVARGVAFVLGVGTTLLVWVSARWLGASRRGAVVAGVLGGALPYAAWLGVAAVPEGPTAALMLFGAACAARAETSRRLLGALALGVACLSRYEAWPAAIAFAALCTWDAGRARRAAYLLPGLVALAAPVLWMLHGAFVHENSLFFVARVAEYRRAVSVAPVSLLASLFRYPLALLRCEPELAALTLTSLALVARSGKPPLRLERYARPTLVLGAVLVVLVVADLRDGAPTHHAERTLLSLWLLMAIVAAETLAMAWACRERRERNRFFSLVGASILVGAIGIRPFFARRDSFIDRSAELAIGRHAAALRRAPGERIVVDTPDFGYFAVLAGYGSPDRGGPLDDRDPRRPQSDRLAEAPAARLAAELSAERARYLVAPRLRRHLATRLGTVRAESERFVVVELMASSYAGHQDALSR